MADNQQGVQGQGQGGMQKPQQPLSWSQSQQKPSMPTTSIAPMQMGMKTSATSKMIWVFVIGLVVGWLLTWAWFDLRSKNMSGANSMATTTNEMGQSGLTVTQTQPSETSTMGMSQGQSGATVAGSPATSAGSGQMSTDSITVPSPQAAGTTVAVSNITGSDAVWAVVYEDNSGVMGRALGAARFTPERISGTVELLRATLPNLTYFVGLVADTPDHSFDIKTNTPLVDENGTQIMTQFTAQ